MKKYDHNSEPRQLSLFGDENVESQEEADEKAEEMQEEEDRKREEAEQEVEEDEEDYQDNIDNANNNNNNGGTVNEDDLGHGTDFDDDHSNGNGDLDYPVGLLTADEIMLAGGGWNANDTYYLYTGQNYWAGSPSNLHGVGAYEFNVYTTGNLDLYNVTYTYGVRPSVSLKPGFSISGGNGTVENPYIVRLTDSFE